MLLKVWLEAWVSQGGQQGFIYANVAHTGVGFVLFSPILELWGHYC